MKQRKAKNNKGFVILFAVTVSAILLSIALGILSVSQKEIKFGSSAQEANNAFYAADTGIESVLFNDKSNTPYVPASGTAQEWNITLTGLGSGAGCAKVIMRKDNTNPPNTTTTITSRGYNFGDANCVSASPNTVEREIQVTY